MNKLPFFGQSMLKYTIALIFTFPNGAVIWFTIMYPVMIVTGERMNAAVHITTIATGMILVFLWSVYEAERSDEIILRSTRLGLIFSLLLPVSSLIVLGIDEIGWIEHSDIDPFGIPKFEVFMYATCVAIIICIVFAVLSKLAYRSLDKA